MLKIIDLATRPDLIPICANWNHGEWGASSGMDRDTVLLAFEKLIQSADRQAARIALWNGEAAGLALLIDNDLETHPHLTPWIASVFVSPAHRGKGIAKKLVGEIEAAAAALGYKEAYLYTEKPDLYRQVGWHDFEELNDENAGMLILRKQIAR
ncbi:GNAT family N-acetyltransferase [Brucella sp. BE17]|uniref:GNAT family N-acetyltransferase n=1 Tax=Brucella sp. BE17 TaxID=3142977 RepID=UPI0031BB321A